VIDWINENHKEVNGQFKLMGISQRYYGVCSGVCDYSRKTWGTIGFTLPLRLKPGTEYLVAIWALILKNLFRDRWMGDSLARQRRHLLVGSNPAPSTKKIQKIASMHCPSVATV